MKSGMFENVNGKLMIGGKFAFYMYQSHGVPVDILEDWVNDWLKIPTNKERLKSEIERQNKLITESTVKQNI